MHSLSLEPPRQGRDCNGTSPRPKRPLTAVAIGIGGIPLLVVLAVIR